MAATSQLFRQNRQPAHAPRQLALAKLSAASSSRTLALGRNVRNPKVAEVHQGFVFLANFVEAEHCADVHVLIQERGLLEVARVLREQLQLGTDVAVQLVKCHRNAVLRGHAGFDRDERCADLGRRHVAGGRCVLSNRGLKYIFIFQFLFFNKN